MPKTMNVRVTTVDAELEFTIQRGTKGKEFFDKVTKTLGVREIWYFGLRYIDRSGLPCWLRLEDKMSEDNVSHQVINTVVTLQFQFLAKYFPEDASEELIFYHTKNLFYLQVKNAILADEYYCSAETAVLLASYAVQTKFGDYNEENHTPGFLDQEQLLPPKIIKQYNMTKSEWDDKVLVWYKQHKGENKETAMMNYLKVAQDLEMYGVNYFEIKNKKGTKLWLGVDALGINVYDFEDKLTPKIGFPWNEVRSVSYKGKKFVIKPTDKNAPDFIFLSPSPTINKEIQGLCNGNYELCSKRRKPDNVEVQQMKNQVKEEQLLREADRQKFLDEKQQREESERQNKELERKLQQFIEQMEHSKQDLEQSQKTSFELEKKLIELEENSLELEESKRKAEEARRLAEEAAGSEKTEKERKEKEALLAQEMLEQKEEEVRQKELEAKNLQEELEQARMIIAQRSLVESFSGSSTPLNDSTSPKHNSGLGYFEEGNKELQTNYGLIDRYDEEKMTKIDVKTSEQLKVLRRELDENKVVNQLSNNDLIYTKNVKEGRDKYKTLKQIRQGNTKIRIEIFESL